MVAMVLMILLIGMVNMMTVVIMMIVMVMFCTNFQLEVKKWKHIIHYFPQLQVRLHTECVCLELPQQMLQQDQDSCCGGDDNAVMLRVVLPSPQGRCSAVHVIYLVLHCPHATCRTLAILSLFTLHFPVILVVHSCLEGWPNSSSSLCRRCFGYVVSIVGLSR